MPGGWAVAEIGDVTENGVDRRLTDESSSSGEDEKGPSAPSVRVVTVRSRGGALLRPFRFLFCRVAMCGSTKYLYSLLASDKIHDCLYASRRPFVEHARAHDGRRARRYEARKTGCAGVKVGEGGLK